MVPESLPPQPQGYGFGGRPPPSNVPPTRPHHGPLGGMAGGTEMGTRWSGPPGTLPEGLLPENPPLVNQYGRYQSIYGWGPSWGPEILPPQQLGVSREPLPDVRKVWPYHGPENAIPSSWMWYRHNKTPMERSSDWEPTIYRDSMTMEATTRTGLLASDPESMFRLSLELNKSFEEVKGEVDAAVADGRELGVLSQGLHLLGRDIDRDMGGVEANATLDDDEPWRHGMEPKTHMGHTLQHGRHNMQLQSKAKLAEKSHFFSPPKEPVHSFLGTVYLEVDGTAQKGIQFA